jgi:hypothetical protein
MNEFIYKSESLSSSICEKIIELFENEPNRMPGKTGSGYVPKIKKTTDFTIPINISIHSKWYEINEALHEQLKYHLNIYIESIKSIFDSTLIDSNFLFENGFMIQKYDKNKGQYHYHHDSHVEINNNISRYRIITFIWYLNDVEKGGETEFFGSYKINPKIGNILFFPCGWIYNHSGKMPVSSDKYIITGWLYKTNENI